MTRAFLWIGALLLSLTTTSLHAQAGWPPFDRAAFEKEALRLGADDERIKALEADIEDLGLSRATDELLRELVPALDQGASMAEDGDPRAPVALLDLVQNSKSAHVRTFARYHVARAFLDAKDPSSALEILAEMLRDDRGRTPLDAEAVYFYATALAEIPKPKAAIEAFDRFLETFPKASRRFRDAALIKRQQLLDRAESPLHDLANRMKKVGNDLGQGEVDEPVQTEQLEITQKLQKILEELEKQEQQSSGAPTGNQQTTSPASNSALPPGASRVGSLSRAPNVIDRWGQVRDREREEIENDVQTRFRGRYRAMLEGYYERLSKKPNDR